MLCGKKPWPTMAARCAAALMLAGLCGCGARPIETAQAFSSAVERRDADAAARFCLPELRAELTNAPYALRVFTSHATNVTCALHDMQGGGEAIAVLLDVEMALDYPPPFTVKGTLVLTLARRGSRWYIAQGQVHVPRYIEFGTERQDGAAGVMWNLSAPRYGSERSVDEPLQDFVRRVDRYCRSFEL